MAGRAMLIDEPMKGVKKEAMVAAKSAAILISLLTVGGLPLGAINIHQTYKYFIKL
jgi:hypothetical protein